MAGDYSERVRCVLCNRPPGDVIFEDAHATVVLHEDWAVRGHVMIVARRHVENVSDLPIDEWLQVARVWHRVERVLLDAAGAERSIAMKLGILTPHLHIHLYPVSGSATREEVFRAIDAEVRTGRDETFVSALLTALRD
jgi:diadenosine tetraphosphate (Ap4A) HIT family hydrolase